MKSDQASPVGPFGPAERGLAVSYRYCFHPYKRQRALLTHRRGQGEQPSGGWPLEVLPETPQDFAQ